MAFFNHVLRGVLGILLGVAIVLGASAALYRNAPPSPTPASPQATTSVQSFPPAPAIATTTPKKSVAPPQPAPKKPAAPVEKIPTSPASIPTTKSSEQVNTETRAALVNILCEVRGAGINPISGSGVMVDTRGIILTNAHLGQYFLLRDYPTAGNINCVVRAGSPATPRYSATLLYLPPAWIEVNAAEIIEQKPLGTGEHDYAFLLITGPVSASISMPATFSALPLTTNRLAPHDPILVAAYPAGFLGGSAIEMNLYITSAVSAIGQLFTFDTDGYIDLVSVGNTIVSQAGSSGGAVVRMQDGALLGLIATATVGTTTADRDLRAITLAHIDRSLASQGKGGIIQLLSGDAAAQAADFNTNTAPALTQKLLDVLPK